MDPNGIYTPSSSTGTFVQCIDATGAIMPMYHEGTVQAVFGPAKWNADTHKIEITGPPSYDFKKPGEK